MIPVATAITMSGQGGAVREADAEGAISSQFDAEIIIAGGYGKRHTRPFHTHYEFHNPGGPPTPLSIVVAQYIAAGYTVTVGPNCGFPPRNPRRSTVKISW